MQKVMLVEDDEMMRSLLGTFLQMEGYEVIDFERDDSLDEIVNKIRHEEPALVLLDVNLRKFSGFDLLHNIRVDADLRQVRVLMSSGMDLGMRCFEEGADGFLLKPYMPDELVGKIQQTLGI